MSAIWLVKDCWSADQVLTGCRIKEYVFIFPHNFFSQYIYDRSIRTIYVFDDGWVEKCKVVQISTLDFIVGLVSREHGKDGVYISYCVSHLTIRTWRSSVLIDTHLWLQAFSLVYRRKFMWTSLKEILCTG